MAYQKTQWQDHIEGVQTGTPVNAANMNKIEDALAKAAESSSGTCSMWTGLADGTYTSPKNVPWCKIGPYCFVEVVFTGTQTARVSKIYGLPYPAKVYCNARVTYTPVSGSAALAGIIDVGKSEITVQWLADNTSNNAGKYYDIRANIIYRVED